MARPRKTRTQRKIEENLKEELGATTLYPAYKGNQNQWKLRQRLNPSDLDDLSSRVIPRIENISRQLGITSKELLTLITPLMEKEEV